MFIQRRAGAMATAFVVVVMAAGCGSPGPVSSEDDNVITIGIASSLTGALSIFDVPVHNAIQMAVDEVNAEGGIGGSTFEIVTADNRTAVDQAAAAALDVLDQGADVVVTTCDYNFGAPAAQEAQKAGKLALSCAGSALFGSVGIGPLAYSVNESTATSGAVGAEFAMRKGWQSAYLLTDTSTDFTTSWCDSFEEAFTALGGQVVGEDTFVQGDSTVSAQVSRLSSAGQQPDVVALCSFPPTGAVAVAQLRSGGVSAPVVTTSGFDGPGWLQAAPGVQDVYSVAAASIYGDDPNPAVNQLVADYTSEYGAPQAAYLAYGKQIAETIFAGVGKAGSANGPELAAALDSFTDEDLLLGPTSYTPGCHSAVGRPMRVIEYTAEGGRFAELLAPTVSITPDGCTT